MAKTITVLVPVYNEQVVLPRLYTRLGDVAKKCDDYEFEFMFIDDGSTDKSPKLLRSMAAHDKRVVYIRLSRNYGKEIAMIAGIDHVDSDATVIIDADLQDPPELIPKMIKLWEDGYDDVYAKRRNRPHETPLKKLVTSVFYRLLERSSPTHIEREVGDFRLLDRRCTEALKHMRESERYTKGLYSWIGYNKKEIMYDRDERQGGSTKWSLLSLIKLAVDGLTSFSTAPLRIASVLGILVSTLAFVYIVYLLIRPIFGVSTGDGYSSLMAAILFFGGVQLLAIGIIGEYIGRIYNESKRRPLYFIDEFIDGSDSKGRK